MLAVGEGARPDVVVFLKVGVVHHPRDLQAVDPESLAAGQRQVAKLIIRAAAGGTGGCRHQAFEAVEQRGDVSFRAAFVLDVDDHPFHEVFFHSVFLFGWCCLQHHECLDFFAYQDNKIMI